MAKILKLQTLHSHSETNHTDEMFISSFSGICPTVSLNGLHEGYFALK
jgi:hypothetical protein